ncbi:MAG TPA: FlgD immunoglobulin-like domain containing protein, partial [Candidatus Cloacimonadota bacterium]|nr:FlgD immunoglobulin-like domain containing protein [Candidatus Cloacimonadota bacterium]
DQFGSPVLKTNQMTMHIYQVQINGTPADAGSRIAAYVVTNFQEELRGNAVVQNGGAATLVINTDVSDENVIFKVWDATNHVLYDSPYTIATIPGATVSTRAPIVINALSQHSLSGTVTDGNSTGLDAILVNRHEKADINPNTNRPFEYSTLADGNYTFLAWQGTPMILEAVKSGYSFVADGTVVGSNLEANAGDFTYPAPNGTNYPAGTVYVTVGFNGVGTTTITDAGALTAVHTGLDFTGTIEQFVVTGNLSFEDMPLVGVTMTISGGGSITTDESGNFFFVVNSGTSGNNIITITQSDLNAAGYGEILLSATPLYISTNDPTIVSDTHLGDVLSGAGKLTQTISLTTGWNLISFNVEHADDSPDAVFGTVNAIKEVRTRDKVWENGVIGTLEHIEANKAYYVRADADENFTAEGKPVPITEITLDQNNWNLIGYPMQLNGQTRTMIKDNADILNINDLKEAYYHIDEPIGASTLRFMMPGSGYWMKTGTVSDPKLNYNQDYSNVIKSLEFRDVANESWVKAEIDNKAAGFPLPVGATDFATNGPKTITVEFAHGQAVTSLAATIDTNTPFTPTIKKVFNETEYNTLIDGLFDANGNVVDWGGFLSRLESTGADIGATLDLSVTTYLIYATDLSTPELRQQAQVAVYCVTSNTGAEATHELFAFGIQNSAETTTVWGTVNQITHIAKVILPHDFATAGAKIVFSIDGAGLHTTNTGTPPQLVSGTTAYTHGVDNITTLTYYVSDSAGSPLYQPYTVQVVKLPVPVSPAPAPTRTPLLAKSSVEEVTDIREAQDPFGQVNYLPNSHYVLGRITNNGSAVHPDYIVAAYIGEELRGKQQVVYYNNMSYIPILVSTIEAGEPITFKIWKDGSVVKTFDNTLLTIPGGRTGNHGAYYQFNMASLDANDTVEPVFVNELGKAYPNPFNPTTTIEFSLKEKQNVSLSIYNVKGQIVKTLVKDQLEKGRHKVVWDGKNNNGQVVGSGIYFYRMDTKDYTKIRKAILLK